MRKVGNAPTDLLSLETKEYGFHLPGKIPGVDLLPSRINSKLNILLLHTTGRKETLCHGTIEKGNT